MLLKRAYANVAQSALMLPPAQSLFNQAVLENKPNLRRWLASLTAIHHLDRMIELDIPWWHMAAAQQVEDFLRSRPDAHAFEYGSGASTIWLAKRCREVVSVEHHPKWYDRMAAKVEMDNCKLLYRSLRGERSEYVHAIEEIGGTFDLIVVDGRSRIACLEVALPFLKTDGMILFDDSGRRRYRAGIKLSGLSERHFFGKSYCVPYPDHSSILTLPSASLQ